MDTTNIMYQQKCFLACLRRDTQTCLNWRVFLMTLWLLIQPFETLVKILLQDDEYNNLVEQGN